jgi:hypothetical protein
MPIIPGPLPAPEVRVGEIQKVEAAEQADPTHLNERRCQQRGDDAKREAADQAVPQRSAVLRLWQPQHHDRHHQRVVGAEQPFQRHEQRDGNEISRLDVQGL